MLPYITGLGLGSARTACVPCSDELKPKLDEPCHHGIVIAVFITLSLSLSYLQTLRNHTACVEDSYLEEFNISACRWWWSGEGFVYQVVAGPVFNNLYPLAGVFTAFLADFGNRKVFLVISLIFWSLATGLTGFAQTFWHLVVLRALLAIG